MWIVGKKTDIDVKLLSVNKSNRKMCFFIVYLLVRQEPQSLFNLNLPRKCPKLIVMVILTTLHFNISYYFIRTKHFEL